MRILLDECLPKDLAREFSGHDVTTVPQAGWASVSNGTLHQEKRKTGHCIVKRPRKGDGL
jgi:hypothetical protein